MDELQQQPTGSGRCHFCDAESGRKLYCNRCRRLLDRKDGRGKHDTAARRKAMESQVEREHHVYKCAYTGLTLRHDGGPLSAEWEHATPANEESVVLAAKGINRMKADLSVEDWDRMIRAVFDYRIKNEEKVPFDEEALPQSWR